jgi:hypothetical protein
VLLGASVPARLEAQQMSPADVRTLARDAYIWGFPIVANYRMQSGYFINKAGPQYRGPFNAVYHNARYYTAEDRTAFAPNDDAFLSVLGADLRAEPLVLSVPAIDAGRYYALQFVDMYTANFDYVGTRTTGNGEGRFLLAGPRWQGETPPGIKKVIRSETEFAFVMYRTQVFGPNDVEAVKKVQSGYKVQTLSAFLGRPAPGAARAIDFPPPLSTDEERNSVQVFALLSFLLQFCPPNTAEAPLMVRLAQLGIGIGKKFDPFLLAPEVRKALEDGMADAWKLYERTLIDYMVGEIPQTALFGSRQQIKSNYVNRWFAAASGIYNPTPEEALFLGYTKDEAGEAPDGARHRYTLRFEPGQLPPVNAFWSLTLYTSPEQQFVANPLRRYLVNSAMVPDLRKDPDGGVTLYVQAASPGKEREANWLPAPAGPFILSLRTYWPKPELVAGTWKQPPLRRAD